MAKNMDVGRLSISMVADTVQYVNKLKEAEERTKKSVNGMNTSFNKMNKTTAKSQKQMNGMSDRLKEMSQSAALVTGPLGGVASRLSILSTVVASGPLVAGIVALSVAITGVVATLNRGITVTDKTIVQLSQLEAQMQLTDGAIGHTTAELDAFARELALNTLTSTVEVREAMGILATTTDLTGDSFKRVTELAQDISQVMGTSLKANAKVLAKALEDPVDGLTKLERLQVSFTDKQKEMVEGMVENGEVLQAQSYILDQIADKYEGIAKKISPDTIAVQADEMGQRWEELAEAVVGVTNTHPALVGYMKSINTMLDGLSREINPQMFFDIDANLEASKHIKAEYGDIANLMDDSIKKSRMLDEIMSHEKGIEQLEKEVQAFEDLNEAIGESSDFEKSMKAMAPVLFGVVDAIDSVTSKNELDIQMFDKQKQLAEAKAYTDQLKALYDGVREAEKSAEESRHKKSLDNIAEEAEDAMKASQKMFDKIKGTTPMDPNYLTDMENDIARIREITNLMGLDMAGVDFDSMGRLDIDAMLKQYEEYLAMQKALDVQYAQGVLADALELEKKKQAQKDALAMEAQYGVGDAETQQLINKYNTELELYREHLRLMGVARSEADEAEKAMAQKLGEDLFNQTMQNQTQQTDWMTSSLDTAMDAMSALGKEGSAVAKAMFLANQAIAIANAYVSMGVARAKAMELGPVAGPPAYASATALGISTIAGIASATVAGIAHGGMDSVPSESTYLLQKGERVVQPKANKDLTAFLNNGGSGSGETTINAPLTVQGNVTDEAWFESKLVKHRASISNMVAKANRERPSRRGR